MSNETNTPEGSQEPGEGLEAPEEAQGSEEEEQDTFPRSYVDKLRKESQSLRERLREAESQTAKADDYAKRLHEALVKADGRLVDPEALPFQAEHLESSEALEEAIGSILEKKPYLSATRFAGPIKQGATKVSEEVNLLSILQARA